MKLSFILLLIFISGTFVFSQTGWQDVSISTTDDFTDIYFIGNSDGFAVGPNTTYKMIKTTDAGINWSTVSISGNGPICLDFYNSTYGFAAYASQAYSTQDGGGNWATRYPSITRYDCCMPTSSIVWLVGNSGSLAKSTDQGVNWTYPSSGVSINFRGVDFYTSTYGWICGLYGTILKTTNSGSNWSEVQLTSSGTALYYMYGIQFIDQNNGWCVGYRSGSYSPIFKTTDGGSNWTLMSHTLTTAQLNGVYFTDSNTGWVVGNSGVILYTSDGGSNWELQTSGTTENLNEVFFLNSSTGWIAGDNGTLLKTTDGGLPVELVSFSALREGKNIILTWQTATEVNNYGFEIERKTVGQMINTSNDWEVIGFVPGNGNCNSPKLYTFTDEAAPENELHYRLKQIDTDGAFEYYHLIAEVVQSSVTSVKGDHIPDNYYLAQNYPNPFNPVTQISFSLPHSGIVSLAVYDALGKNTIELIMNENYSAGRHTVSVDASNLASGVYFYTIKINDFTASRKMIVVK